MHDIHTARRVRRHAGVEILTPAPAPRRAEAPAGSRFFKVIRPDGIDFHTGTVRWLPADGAPIPEGGWLVEHPHPGVVGDRDAVGYLSAATVPTDCTGFQWPARLLLVEPVGDVWTPHPARFPRKRAAHAWRVVRELPAWRIFGPQGREVAAIIEQASHLTKPQIAALDTALDTAFGIALDAAWAAARAATSRARIAALDATLDAALDAALDAELDTAWRAVWVACGGLLVADLISDEDFRTLTGPWTQVMGPIEVTA